MMRNRNYQTVEASTLYEDSGSCTSANQSTDKKLNLNTNAIDPVAKQKSSVTVTIVLFTHTFDHVMIKLADPDVNK